MKAKLNLKMVPLGIAAVTSMMFASTATAQQHKSGPLSFAEIAREAQYQAMYPQEGTSSQSYEALYQPGASAASTSPGGNAPSYAPQFQPGVSGSNTSSPVSTPAVATHSSPSVVTPGGNVGTARAPTIASRESFSQAARTITAVNGEYVHSYFKTALEEPDSVQVLGSGARVVLGPVGGPAVGGNVVGGNVVVGNGGFDPSYDSYLAQAAINAGSGQAPMLDTIDHADRPYAPHVLTLAELMSPWAALDNNTGYVMPQVSGSGPSAPPAYVANGGGGGGGGYAPATGWDVMYGYNQPAVATEVATNAGVYPSYIPPAQIDGDAPGFPVVPVVPVVVGGGGPVVGGDVPVLYTPPYIPPAVVSVAASDACGTYSCHGDQADGFGDAGAAGSGDAGAGSDV